jgi:DNA-binding PadR family transcriptional regulator
VSMKEAVLGLVVERRGYGYDLIRRFNGRFGEAWCLNPSTVYTALDTLELDGYVIGIEEERRPTSSKKGPSRGRKVTYEATPAGREHFLTWLTAPIGEVEPARAEIFLKIGLATREHALALIGVLDAQINACAEALAERLSAYGLDIGSARSVSWDVAATWFINDGGISRLQADLDWLRRVRAGAEALRRHGVVPLTALVTSAGLPPGWR